MPHLGVEHREEPKQKVESDHIGEVEGKVPLVGKLDGKLFCFFKVGNVSQSYDTFTDKSQWVQRYPQGVPKEGFCKVWILGVDIVT